MRVTPSEMQSGVFCSGLSFCYCALEFTLTSYMLWATNNSSAAIHSFVLIEKLQCLVQFNICGPVFPTSSAVDPNLLSQNTFSYFVS